MARRTNLYVLRGTDDYGTDFLCDHNGQTLLTLAEARDLRLALAAGNPECTYVIMYLQRHD